MILKFKKFRDKILKDRMASQWKNKIELAANISTSITKVIDQFPAKT